MIKKVNLTISQLRADLDSGMTWLQSEDQGYGSIQDKYNMKEEEITEIKKHPKLENYDPEVIIFNIIDDLEEVDVNLDEPEIVEEEEEVES